MTEQAHPETLDRAFAVLLQAVRESTHPGHTPRASQVRLAMKRLTYDGFDPTHFSFRRFRDFLEAAQSAGVIILRDRPGDIEVLAATPDAGPSATSKPRVRRDIWRSFVDWNPDALHYLDLDSGKAVEIPREPVDLEPARFSDIRARVAAEDPRLVLVPSVPVGEQIRWMRQFSEEVENEPLRSLLVGALAGEKPAKNFNSIVRADRGEQRRWNLFFGERVLDAIRAWIGSSPRLSEVEIFDVDSERDTAAAESDDTAGEMPLATRDLIEAASRLVGSAQSAHTARGRATMVAPSLVAAGSDTRLRALVHRAVDRMSEDELRSLRLPVGALVDEA